MDGEHRPGTHTLDHSAAIPDFPPYLDGHFAAEPYRELGDAAERKARIADLAAFRIAPRLEVLHAAVLPPDHPTSANVAELARLVLSPDEREAAAYVADLRDHGLSVDLLFSELLEPAAQLLGVLWEDDEVDFIDVTLGVARLQALLSVYNRTCALAALGDYRSVLMLTIPGEQHSFGAAMVEQLLEAGGWQVASERGIPARRLAERVGRQWFAVAGIALSNPGNLDAVAAAIATIRSHSSNKAIGVMVGGPAFSADPSLARAVGADGTAASGPTAVVLAQKLLDDALVAAPNARRPAAGNRPIAGSAARSAN